MDDGCWLFEPKSASPSVLGSTKMTNDEHPPLFGRIILKICQRHGH